jgi:type I restriction enzyme R subunit
MFERPIACRLNSGARVGSGLTAREAQQVAGVTSEGAFEESIEAHLLAHGWRKGNPAEYDKTLGLVPAELAAFLAESQPQAWEQLALRLGGDAAAVRKVASYVARELDRRGTVDVLRRETKMNGVSFRLAFFAPANGLTPALWERFHANRLSIVRQLHHSQSRPHDSLDVTLFVNGLPTATAELKNPLTHQSAADAMKQYQSDRVPSDLIFRRRALVHFAVDPNQVYMSTRLAGVDTVFLPFNQGSGGAGRPGGAGNPANPDGYPTSYLWERVWERSAWLGLLGDFVHVADVLDEQGERTGATRVLFPRFHQWDAVQKILAATRAAGPGTDRLIQHSAGSGKSNTIAWTAHHLSRLHTPSLHGDLTDEVRAAGLGVDQPIFNKVVVITDRVVLDRQLQATVAGFEHTPVTIVKIDENSQQLREALAGHTARIIITTLQKFPVVAEAAGTVAGSRFAVIVDEAHSSTTGEAMKDLKAVLGDGPRDGGADESSEATDATDVIAASMSARGRQANIAFFAFTATPKPKTLELFGELAPGMGNAAGGEVRVPFHLYSMRQAIEEHFILDVLANYTTYDTYYRLANVAPADDRDVPKSKAAAALARYVSLHPTNLAQKAEIIVEHFRQKTAGRIGGRAKVMVVTRSRLHAVRYKIAIDDYLRRKGYDRGPNRIAALVAFSDKITDPDTQATYTEALMNGFGEAQLPKRFASDEYQVLVVAEKYQTGFDQPLLHTMYVDKKLAGVPAQPHASRQDRHVRAGLRQLRRGDHRGVRAVLRAERGRTDRSEPALHARAHDRRRRRHPPGRAGRCSRGAAHRRRRPAEARLREPHPGGRSVRRARGGRAGAVPPCAALLPAGVRVPGADDAVDRAGAGVAVPVRPGASAATAGRPRRPAAADQRRGAAHPPAHRGAGRRGEPRAHPRQ